MGSDGAGRNGKLEVKAPHLPGLAVPGDYMLFVVNDQGVPSEGQYVQLGWADDDQ
ncbi:MAG: galactose oxidase-like domain-containing protein [Myxococcota bacterium]